ncbi:MAG TPA: hypothetical protein VHS78_18635 [Candidatus Elarobacter sp.]|jgi:hypothetical protein|nr:hypothetical protein [Candidatus Elarobacter sp.]
MLKAVASSVAAAAIALVAAGAGAQTPKPAATPFAIGTLQPFGPSANAPFTQQLPNIGRTRSVTAGCAAMRDVVIPSFKAALTADQRFVETRKRLPNYAELVDDPEHQNDVYRISALHKLGQDAASLMQDAQVMSKALGDPRLSAETKDPQILAERRALEALYTAQVTRANLLNEYVMREQAATAKQGLEDNGAFHARNDANAANVIYAPNQPMPQLTAPPNMPLRSGIGLADKRTMEDWGTTLHTYVHTAENQAAKTFYSIAQSCTK